MAETQGGNTGLRPQVVLVDYLLDTQLSPIFQGRRAKNRILGNGDGSPRSDLKVDAQRVTCE